MGMRDCSKKDAVLILKADSETHLIVMQVKVYLLEFYSDIIYIMLFTFAALDQEEELS